VYCEAPLAATLDDARARLPPRRMPPASCFRVGCRGRANPLYRHVLQFVKSGVLRRRSRWSMRNGVARTAGAGAAPTPRGERAVNWRLAKGSPGLMVRTRDPSTGSDDDISWHYTLSDRWQRRHRCLARRPTDTRHACRV
jgi:hypothetical protein